MRILLLEDSNLDAELVTEHLELTGLDYTLDRALAQSDYITAIDCSRYDLILADYVLPGFDGMSALRLARERCPHTPFIFVSGTLGEDIAVEALKRGATDYVLKQRLERLPATVMRALAEARERAERRRAEEALREREAQLRAAVSAASLATYEVDCTTGKIRGSSRLAELCGYPEDHALTLDDIRARYHPDDLGRVEDAIASALDPTVQHFEVELRLVLPDGAVRWVNGRGEYLRDESGRLVRARGVAMDVTERKRWEERQQLLIHELNHRVKNTLATVQSIASLTLRNAPTTHEARQAFEGRLLALSRAHDLLTRESWEGANLFEIVAQAVAPYRMQPENRFKIAGPGLRLTPALVLPIAMALQELLTNAVKYGSLSGPAGEVHIGWSVNGDGAARRLHLRWEESGGPPVQAPTRRGFGSRLIERSLAQDLSGQVQLSFPETGVVCTIDAPV